MVPDAAAGPGGLSPASGDWIRVERAEAGWLQERMLGGTEGSLLHHLVSDGNRPEANSDAPWDDPICHTSAPR